MSGALSLESLRTRAFSIARSQWLTRLALCILALPALWHVIHLAGIIATRLTYPMDLEWMEGGLLYEATRLLEGLPVYPDPQGGYVPFPYPIGYPLLLAALGALFGVDYDVARIISIVATGGAAYVLARQVFVHYSGERARWLAACLCFGAIAAGYPVVDGWYDLARVDALAAFLLIGAAALVSEPFLSKKRAIVAGLLLAAGALTKQSTVPLAAWVVLFALLRHRSRATLLLCVGGGSFGLALAALQWVTDGNYWFYTVTLLQKHQVRVARIVEGHKTLAAFAPYALALPLLGGLLAVRRCLAARTTLWLGLGVVSWGFGIVSFAKDGGYLNNFIPAVWLIAPVVLLVLRDAMDAGKSTDLRWVMSWSCFVALSWWLVQSSYPAKKFAVPDKTRARAEALNERIASVDGTLFAPLFPHLAVRNGKGIHQVHIEAHNDFIWARRPFREPYARYVDEIAADYVLLDGTEATLDIIKRRYVTVERLNPRRFDTRTRIGWSVAPRLLLERKDRR